MVDIRGLDRTEINNIKQLCNEEGFRGNVQNFVHRLERNGYKQRILNSDSIDSKDRESTVNNVRLDSQAQGRKTFRGQSPQYGQTDFQGSQIKIGYDGTSSPWYISTEYLAENDFPCFITPQGEVYGFVDKDGNIYLDETVITP